MDKEKLRSFADSIVFNLADKGLEIEEAVNVLKIADGIVRAARGRMFERLGKASLKETLKEAANQPSSISDSAEM